MRQSVEKRSPCKSLQSSWGLCKYAVNYKCTNVEEDGGLKKKKKLGRGRELLTRKDQKRLHDDACGI